MAPTAIVTGGSGGIGRACVRTLAPDHDVLIHYHTDEAAARSLADEVAEATGRAAVTFGADLASFDDVEAMVTHARSTMGPVALLVNNAGSFEERSIPELTPEHVTAMLGVNLLGPLFCTQAVLSDMLDRGGGRIVNVSSTGATRGSTTAPAYSAAKGGVVAFTKTLARRYTADGILSNAVAPSATDTAMYPDDRREAAAAGFPQGRLVRPEEVAEAVRFFATTTYVSGEVLEVDGGRYT